MENLTKTLAATLIGMTLATVFAAQAGNPLASPRAKSNEIKRTTGTTPDMIDRSIQTIPPKVREQQASLRKVSGTTADVLDRSYAGIPKLREQLGSSKVFYVAPLK